MDDPCGRSTNGISKNELNISLSVLITIKDG